MANYHCAARTNYFRVKDEAAFRAWAVRRGVEVAESFAVHRGHFAVFATDGEAFPNYDSDRDEEVDFAAELAGHLAPDSVAVLLEVGAEKLCYLVGMALAVNAHGQRLALDLADIYRLAEQAFIQPAPTRAEY